MQKDGANTKIQRNFLCSGKIQRWNSWYERWALYMTEYWFSCWAFINEKSSFVFWFYIIFYNFDFSLGHSSFSKELGMDGNIRCQRENGEYTSWKIVHSLSGESFTGFSIRQADWAGEIAIADYLGVTSSRPELTTFSLVQHMKSCDQATILLALLLGPMRLQCDAKTK